MRTRRAALVACLVGLLVATSGHAAFATTKIELSGADRYETAVAISKAAYPGFSQNVVLATGESWPDALAGAALAGKLDCPVLLTRSDSLPKAVGLELVRLNVYDVYMLGGPNAVSTAIEDELEDEIEGYGFFVHRLSGADRYKTAAAISWEVVPPAYSGPAILATGANFPDSLAAGPLAAYMEWPIFLANPRGYLPITEMKDRGVNQVLIVGGTSAVSAAQEAQLRAEFGSTKVLRIAGTDRYDTAARVAQEAVSKYGLHWNLLSITTGQTFPDALAGGPFAAKKGSVMLITPSASLHSAPKAKLQANAGSITSLYYLGGKAAVSTAVRNQVANILP